MASTYSPMPTVGPGLPPIDLVIAKKTKKKIMAKISVSARRKVRQPQPPYQSRLSFSTSAIRSNKNFSMDSIDSHSTVPAPFLEFTESPRPSFRHYIKDVAFTRRSTCADDGDCKQFWEPLRESINHHMPLKYVTDQLPPDRSHGIDQTKEAREAPDSEWYWWAAPRL